MSAGEQRAGSGGGGWQPRLGYVPYHELGGRPNVIVDGSPASGTVLCLTHWPGIASPAAFRADLSAQMAFAYLAAYDCHAPATAVSNNHFDQDGLVALYALACPAEALARRELLTDVARAGDFARFSSRDAARISMTLSSYATPGRSPLPSLAGPYPELAAQLYTELLGRLPEMCEKPERYRHVWAEEDASLAASEAALADGRAVIEDVPELDLAVVTLAADAPRSGGHRFAGEWADGMHPMALCNATSMFTLLVIRDGEYELTCRYETWVQYRSRRPRPRADLAPLAEQLNAAETGPARWVADPPSALTPRLRTQGGEHSSLGPDLVRQLAEEHLRHAPPAWDPYVVPPAG